jgi:2-methylcitrate dehydratase PrpD
VTGVPGETGESAIERIAAFVVSARPPAEARRRAGAAIVDTVGVALAGSPEPSARAVRAAITSIDEGPSRVWGTSMRASVAEAALANGTAAHALDYDDMCFVSLAHPSAPLVPAVMAAGEVAGASGGTILDAYVVGFEVEARLGRAMNPSHYQRGWHCTSTIGVMGAAAAASRVFGLDAATTAHALAIAASSASGLKENFGTMIKPLHAGLAARDAIVAAQLAAAGLMGSAHAIDGAQGLLHATDGESSPLAPLLTDLGQRWEILDTGITVKLYPSCAGTHPAIDAVLELRRTHGIGADDVVRAKIGVDRITPTILIHDRPVTGLEAKFSMPFCVAAALVHGRVGLDTFESAAMADERVRAVLPRVEMNVDSSLDATAPALTQTRVRLTLRDGRVLEAYANGARGYPAQPASEEELTAKFLGCAERILERDAAVHALESLRNLREASDIRAIAAALSPA